MRELVEELFIFLADNMRFRSGRHHVRLCFTRLGGKRGEFLDQHGVARHVNLQAMPVFVYLYSLARL